MKGLPSPTAWLWWAALALLMIGAGVAYMITLHAPDPDPDAINYAVLVLAGTVVAAGLCVIGATAGWWLRR